MILEKDKIRIRRLERYLEELKDTFKPNTTEWIIWSIEERIVNVEKAILYYKGDKTQIFDPTIIEDIVR